MTLRRRALALVLSLALAPACASFVPLREPPPLAIEDPPGNATTREEVVAHFGPPQERRASDLGEVLVYRRRIVTEWNPNRYHGEDRGARLDRYELVLVYLDADGRVVRTSIEPE
jgi:hypothetical protein